MSAVASPDPNQVLSKSLLRAGKALGLTQADLALIIGRDRSSIARGIDPASKSGELALLLIRCYRALFVLVGDEGTNMRHWFATENLHTGGVPKEQVKSVQGLTRVMEYLDAIRGRI